MINFEEDYEDIKNNPNLVWEKHYKGIMGTVARNLRVSGSQMHTVDELIQECYIWFRKACEEYKPFYNDSFIPFDKYLFSYLIFKMRGHIQFDWKKSNREKPTEIDHNQMTIESNVNEIVNDIVYKEFIEKLPPNFAKLIELKMMGLKQQDIASIMKTSQSRISDMLQQLNRHYKGLMKPVSRKKTNYQKIADAVKYIKTASKG